MVVLSVKPQILEKVLREIGDRLKPGTLVISIAAGVDTATIEHAISEGVRVVRAMPNTPALVGAGATAVSPGSRATADNLAVARALFDAVGISSSSTRRTSTRSPGCRARGPRTFSSSSKRSPTRA